MIDPFTAWLRMASASLEMTRTGLRAAETLSASGDVVARRGAIIRTALATPFAADHAELARMVPEKLDAFSKAGMAMTTEYLAMQAGLFGEFQNIWAMALRGRPPTFGEASALADRAAAFGMRETERAAKLGGVGLAPIHRQATSNARRLKRARTRGTPKV